MKTIEEIYEEMLAVFTARSGYVPGESCDLAVRLYALAAQVHSLYAQGEWLKRQAFPQSAEGEYLDYHAEMRGLRRREAVAATGVLRFFAAAAEETLTIPRGTVCLTPGGIRFETLEEAALLPGALSADAPAAAVEAGASGNVAAGQVTLLSVAPAGIVRCTNPTGFSGGAAAEEDAALRGRVLASYHSLPNGANAAYYEQEAVGFAGVAAAQAVGRARGIGTVDVYIAAAGGAPTEELLEAVRRHLQEKREIAVDVAVRAPETAAVDITAALTCAEGYSWEETAAEAAQALHAFFSGALLGRGVTIARLGNLLYSLKSVANYAIAAPSEDLPGAVGVLPVLGTLTLSEGV